MLLTYFRWVWDVHFPNDRFVDQIVTVTVPASFDVAAQQATLEAAERARYPDTIRLLEEPQAAFYRWMEAGGRIGDEIKGESDATNIETVLVVDIGGGTSDFSFFRIKEGDGEPVFERVAVSEHILLGGDNIDLALAHAVESVLEKPEGEELSGEQWRHLIARARELKERCLGSAGDSESEALRVAIPARGSGLLEGTLVAEIESEMVRSMLIDGFFPDCPKGARPDSPQRGLQEWGLPYAPDFAVTRYLADFTRDLGSVDAVLFNGGTLSSPALKERLLSQLGKWQDGKTPLVLSNPETDLAVARGAAYGGGLRSRKKQRIEAGSRRAIYMEVGHAEKEADSQLVCVLPKGAIAGEKFRVEKNGLNLMVNQLARFQTYQGANDRVDTVGDLLQFDARYFTHLPLLETKVKVDESMVTSPSVKVSLESSLNELGLLEVRCVSVEDGITGSWPLHFSLRGVEKTDEGRVRANDDGLVVVSDLGVSEILILKAEASLRGQLKRKSVGKDRLTASRLTKVCERDLGLPKHEWNLLLLRRLADCLMREASVRDGSTEQAEAWAYLAGYTMRPGFGDANDEQRIALLWEELNRERGKTTKGVATQELILLRRIAGGLSQEWQEAIYEREFPKLDAPKGATAERIRLLGSLEKLTEIRKGRLIGKVLNLAVEAHKEKAHVASCLAALAGLLSRSLFKAGPEFVVSPAWVENAWDRMRKWDWTEDRLRDVKSLFLQAARVVEERRLNVSSSLSKKIFNKLKKSGVPETKLRPLTEFVALTRAEQVSAYGEALPAGLVMGKD